METETIPFRISYLLRKRNLTLVQLQQRTGISHSTLQRYAVGHVDKMPVDRLAKIAEALNVSPAYLMGWDTPSGLDPQQDTLTDFENKLLLKFRTLSGGEQEAVNTIIDVITAAKAQ